MIIGIGTDIVEVFRIEAMIGEHGESFIEKIFTDQEKGESLKRQDPAQYFAGRWAAKEALSKALGCGFGAQCSWRDINIINAPNGRPEMTLEGNALETSNKLGINHIHLSISHEKHYACASVVVES